MTDVPELTPVTRPFGILRNTGDTSADSGHSMRRLRPFAGLLHATPRPGQRPRQSFSYLVLRATVLDDRDRIRARPPDRRPPSSDRLTSSRPPTVSSTPAAEPGSPSPDRDSPVRFREVLRRSAPREESSGSSTTGGDVEADQTPPPPTADDRDETRPRSTRTDSALPPYDADAARLQLESARRQTPPSLRRGETDSAALAPDVARLAGLEPGDLPPTEPPSFDPPTPPSSPPPESPSSSPPALTPRRDEGQRPGTPPDGPRGADERGSESGATADENRGDGPTETPDGERSAERAASSNGTNRAVALTVRRSSTPEADEPRPSTAGPPTSRHSADAFIPFSPDGVTTDTSEAAATAPSAPLGRAPPISVPARASLSDVPRDDLDYLVRRIQRELERAQQTERQRLGL